MTFEEWFEETGFGCVDADDPRRTMALAWDAALIAAMSAIENPADRFFVIKQIKELLSKNDDESK